VLAEILIYGLVTSAVYAMLALGLTLIIGIARVMNLAHGAFYMLGAYALYTTVSSLKLPLFITKLLHFFMPIVVQDKYREYFV
jgi:branched-chain amino acid transport system permease protein